MPDTAVPDPRFRDQLAEQAWGVLVAAADRELVPLHGANSWNVVAHAIVENQLPLIAAEVGPAARHRPAPGYLLPRDDPRIAAAIAASRCLGTFDWRDIAEIVNAVLEADDRLVAEEVS